MNEDTILGIDIGNSHLHWGFIQNGIVSKYSACKHSEINSIPWSIIYKHKCPIAIAGTTEYIKDSLTNKVKEHNLKLLEINTDKQDIIKNIYPTLGSDRVCNLIACLNIFHDLSSSIIVFDFGTATTVTSCGKDGDFLGGLIKAGLITELKALSSQTTLPHITTQKTVSDINIFSKNTEDAILHGVISGQIAFIQYYLKTFQDKTNSNPKVIFTGGNAAIITRFYKRYDLYEPHLTLKGIYYTYQACIIKS